MGGGAVLLALAALASARLTTSPMVSRERERERDGLVALLLFALSC
jgi:hypothetical protein